MANDLAVATTELARHFGDYLARVRYGGGRLIVMKNNTPVAELRALPVARPTLREFLDLWGSLPVDPDFAADLDRVNRADRPLEDPWG